MEYPIVILHGWGATTKSYDRLKPLLEEGGHSVVVFDLPGFGNEPAPPKGWSVDDYAEWVMEKIKKELDSRWSLPRSDLRGGNDKAEGGNDNDRKIILFGHSFGGRIAIKIAAERSEGLAGLVLCDAAGVTPRPKIKIALFNFLSKIGNAIFSLPLLNILQPLARKFVYWLSGERDYYYLQGGVMQKTFRKVVGEDLTSYLPKIHTPTLVVWGGKDKMTPLGDAYIIHRGIVGSKLEILGNIGHNPHREVPEKLADIVDKFIKTSFL
jgi:pimeloyl-ACP methyl ester carboxylesterase